MGFSNNVQAAENNNLKKFEGRRVHNSGPLAH